MQNYYGAGTGEIWLDYTDCTGDEESIVYCSHAEWGVMPDYYKRHSYDVSIYCRPGMFTAPSVHTRTHQEMR